jgi:hypothetical protein
VPIDNTNFSLSVVGSGGSSTFFKPDVSGGDAVSLGLTGDQCGGGVGVNIVAGWNGSGNRFNACYATVNGQQIDRTVEPQTIFGTVSTTTDTFVIELAVQCTTTKAEATD